MAAVPQPPLQGSIKVVFMSKQHQPMCNEGALNQLVTDAGILDKPVNVATIVGPARTGKSTMMNLMSGKCLFETAPTHVPCTKGIDLSKTVMDSKSLLAVEDSKDVAATADTTCSPGPFVLFADAEGSGDKGVAYDVSLLAPMLLVSKVIILNHSGGWQVDTLLQSCGILVELASRMNLARGGFGHLHIRCVDFGLAATEAALRESLLTNESEDSGGDTILSEAALAGIRTRNRTRKLLNGWFQSVNVWMMPAPGCPAGTQVTLANCRPEYAAKLRDIRRAVQEQVKTPATIVATGMGTQPVITGRLLAVLLPKATESMRLHAHIMPRSLLDSMYEAQAHAATQAALHEFHTRVDDIRASWTEDSKLSNAAEANMILNELLAAAIEKHLVALDPSVQEKAHVTVQAAGAQSIKHMITALNAVVQCKLLGRVSSVRLTMQTRYTAQTCGRHTEHSPGCTCYSFIDIPSVAGSTVASLSTAFDTAAQSAVAALESELEHYADMPCLSLVRSELDNMIGGIQVFKRQLIQQLESRDLLKDSTARIAKIQAEADSIRAAAEANDAAAQKRMAELTSQMQQAQAEAAQKHAVQEEHLKKMRDQVADTESKLEQQRADMLRQSDMHSRELAELRSRPPVVHNHGGGSAGTACPLL